MLAESRLAIERRLGDDDLVLDVGGWARPWARADWVIDLFPYDTRGRYGHEGDPAADRFSAATWVERDICTREPWPFADDQFDFAVCSHTLEDVRDPLAVCEELIRVARAGYVEVPSRLEEQAWGVQGPWAGWSHHRWLVDVHDGGLDFTFKPGVVHARREYHLPQGFHAGLSDDERVQRMWWEGSFEFRELVFIGPERIDPYLAAPVEAHAPVVAARGSALRSLVRRIQKPLGRFSPR